MIIKKKLKGGENIVHQATIHPDMDDCGLWQSFIFFLSLNFFFNYTFIDLNLWSI
jgi:hypothetical protein